MSADLMAAVGAVLRTERIARGFTQWQLAALADGRHAVAVSKIERGVQQDVGVVTLQRYADALSLRGVPITAAVILADAERRLERKRP